MAAAKLTNAKVRGAKVASEELWFEPDGIIGGKVEAEIGTAGSIPMLLLTVLPICAFAKEPVQLSVRKGGTDVRNSPTVNYMKYVLLPTLSKMGLRAQLEVRSFGYYPIGMGEVVLRVQPTDRLTGLRLTEFGDIGEVGGISVCTFLRERRVAERQADAAMQLLRKEGHRAKVEILYDTSNPVQKGSSIVLWATTTSGVLLGADAIGELRKTSEAVGIEAARNLLEELMAKATVDVHLADMLIPYVAIARGGSAYLARSLTEHLEANIWLATEFLGVKFLTERAGDLFRIERL